VGQEAQSSAPVLLFNGILSSHEVIELFELYATSGLHTQLPADSSRSVPLSFFEHCNRQAPLLEQSIHTPSTIAARSPFLFTCSASTDYPTPYQALILTLQSALSRRDTTRGEPTASTPSAFASLLRLHPKARSL
jgi:hypothetical protein